MKKIILFLVLLNSTLVSLKAQTYDEWFRQKKTQLKYLVQQIAAFQLYEGYLHKGYDIAKQGLNTISNIKSGEFNLHQVFFSSLSKVNPAVQHYSRIADVVALQADILEQYRRCFKNAKQSNRLNSKEVQYISSVFSALLDGCANDISDLIAVTTTDQLQLGDDERIQHIDAIYKNMQSKYLFAKSFSNEANMLILNRQKEQNESAALKTLYHLK